MSDMDSEFDRKAAQAAALRAAWQSDYAYIAHGLGERKDAYIGRLSIVAGSLVEYDLRDRKLKRLAPECRFVNRAPRKG